MTEDSKSGPEEEPSVPIFESRPADAEPMPLEAFHEVLSRCSFPGLEFLTGPLGDGFFLQVSGRRPDSDTGLEVPQHGRKWYVSRHSVPSEIVQTAFLAVLSWLEHEARESFTYRGARLFSPHFNAEFLARAASGSRP